MYYEPQIFENRRDAGKKLGKLLATKKYNAPIVLALPRGGVTVADEVAHILNAHLDVVIARKVGAPGQAEFGIGAISENEIPIFNPSTMNYFDLNSNDVISTIDSEINELRRRILHYRQGRILESMHGKTIILVDDGLATGVSAAAAGKFLRTLKPQKIILAVPVAPHEIDSFVREQFDEIICLYQPLNFSAVGIWYDDFTQVEDDEVMKVLEKYNPNPSEEVSHG